MDVKKSSAGFVSLEDMFEKYTGRKFNPEKDTILNSIYQGIRNQQMMGGQGMNQFADQYGNEERGTSQDEENPFEKSLMNYLENNLGKNSENS